jgi:transposase
MVRFVEPVLDRHQHCFLRETLEESIPTDAPVRVFDFILDQHDWREWEAAYPGGGRPAYPPREMCGLLIYGYSVGIRSSRALEHACRYSKDFIWLMSGRTPDHDTIASFRRQHLRQFKALFRTTVAACVEAGMVSMKHVAVDGSRVEANNGRGQTKTAEDLEQMLASIDARIEKIVAEAEAKDAQEDTLFGKENTPNDLPRELRDLKTRHAKLKQAYEKIQAKMTRAMEVEGASAEQAARKRVPVTDPDSDVMKDKKGTFAPNYTPYVGTDSQTGVVVAEGVTNSHQDADHLQPALEEAKAATGQAVQQAQADSNYTTPDNVTYCETHDIDPCLAPVNSSLEPGKPAASAPPWPEGVPQQAPHTDGSTVDGTALPRTSKGKLDKSAFTYDAESDCYTCPTGHPMPQVGTKKRRRKDRTTERRVYRCSACAACPFRAVCTSDAKGRTINRDEDEEFHARQAERMQDPQRRADYRKRRGTVEPVFGILKEAQRFRRSLLRGLAGVRGEWSLACAAFNLKKLARWIADHPAEVQAAPAVAAG